MIASLAEFWTAAPARQRPAPAPPRRTQPLLIGDILTARGGEPELLIRWRQDRAAADGDGGQG